jgi:hypothetical protein
MILLSDVGEIDVPDLIFVVEIDKEVAVSDWDISHIPVAGLIRQGLFDGGI